MSRALYVITEDEWDSRVLETLLIRKGYAVKVIWYRFAGTGIDALARQLDQLIRTLLIQRRTDDCIVILHDYDTESRLKYPTPYQQIQEICTRYGANVLHIVAKDELEAWLLADGGLCDWLGIKPANHDEHLKPKEKLNSLLKAKGKKQYSGPGRDAVIRELKGSGDQHSPSMREAFNRLLASGCLD